MISKGIIRIHQSRLAIAFRLCDIIIICFTLWVIITARSIPINTLYIIAGILGCLCFSFCAVISNLYRSWRGESLYKEIWRVWIAWSGTIFTLLIAAFATKTSSVYSRFVVFAWFLAAPIMLSVWRTGIRLLLRHLRQTGKNRRIVAIAGAGVLGCKVVQIMLDAPWLGFAIVGFFDDFKQKGAIIHAKNDLDIKGNLNDLVSWAVAGKIDDVYIALPMRAEARIREIVAKLADSSISLYIIPDLFILDILSARLVDIGGVFSVSVFEGPFSGVTGWLKRFEDIIISSLIIVLIVVPMIFIAIGVKFSSPGPIIFKQRRYGLDGKEIVVWKFRTMSVCEDGCDIEQAKKCDPRVTNFGAFLRRNSLDELPQFVNVIQGRMAIVGPRPHAVAHNIRYRKLIPGYMLRHRVKPGITGLAQVDGWRGETDTLEKMEKRIEADLKYVRHWSLFLDLKIILLTVIKGAWRSNAY